MGRYWSTLWVLICGAVLDAHTSAGAYRVGAEVRRRVLVRVGRYCGHAGGYWVAGVVGDAHSEVLGWIGRGAARVLGRLRGYWGGWMGLEPAWRGTAH